MCSQNLPIPFCLGLLNIVILSLWAVFRHKKLFRWTKMFNCSRIHSGTYHPLSLSSFAFQFFNNIFWPAFLEESIYVSWLGQNCSQTDPIPTSPSCPLGLHHHGYFRWMPFVLIEHHSSCSICLYKFIIKASCKRKPNSSNTTIVSHSVKLTALPSCILHLFDYKKP